MTVEFKDTLKADLANHPNVDVELADKMNTVLRGLLKEDKVDHALVLSTKDGVSYGGARDKNLGLACLHLMNMQDEGTNPGLMVHLVRTLSDYLNKIDPKTAGVFGRMLVVHNDGHDIAEVIAECVAEAISEEKPTVLH